MYFFPAIYACIGLTYCSIRWLHTTGDILRALVSYDRQCAPYLSTVRGFAVFRESDSKTLHRARKCAMTTWMESDCLAGLFNDKFSSGAQYDLIYI